MTLADILDREKAATMLARQAPWWTPGTAVGYHAITFGPLIGEVVRRVTGQTLTEFFAEQVAAPLGADYHIGAPPECDHRVSSMVQSKLPRLRRGDGSISDKTFFNPYVMPQDSATIAWRRGELGGSNGHGNARSVAAVQSVLSNGGEARGVRLLSRAGAERALELQADAVDLVAGFPLRWALGFALSNPTIDSIVGNRIGNRRIAFWGGSGGSMAVNDFDARMTFGYVMNRHVEGIGFDERSAGILCAAYDSLAEIEGRATRVA
jgi:CubicO group peptidase (beta-lactamase class C family)